MPHFINVLHWHFFPKAFRFLGKWLHKNLKIRELTCYKRIPFKPQIKKTYFHLTALEFTALPKVILTIATCHLCMSTYTYLLFSLKSYPSIIFDKQYQILFKFHGKVFFHLSNLNQSYLSSITPVLTK